MKYYDYGVNMAANNGFLMYFVARLLPIAFYAVAIFSQCVLQRRIRN